MKFNLENLNPSTWFYFDEADESAGAIALRICSGDDLKAIHKAAVKEKVEYKNHQRFEYTDVNEDLRNDMIWEFCITDWKGVLDSDGKPIPCTKEMKSKLMGGSLMFAKFVTKCLEELAEVNKGVAEDTEKN